jgi:hypothetical protein
MHDDQPAGVPSAARFARTSLWAGDPAALERWIAHATATVAPMVAGLHGNVGAAFLIDRQAGRALTITFWSSEDAAARSDAAAERSRSTTGAATGIELLERGRFEVAGRI